MSSSSEAAAKALMLAELAADADEEASPTDAEVPPLGAAGRGRRAAWVSVGAFAAAAAVACLRFAAAGRALGGRGAGEALAVQLAAARAPGCPDFSVLKHGFGTNCPNDDFLVDAALGEWARSGEDLVVFDVGCNTALESVRWLEPQHPGLRRLWAQSLLRESNNHEGGCQEEGKAARAAPSAVPGVGSGSVKVLCVEPLPVNVALLKRVATEVFGGDAHMQRLGKAMELVPLAASDSPGVAYFPEVAPPGFTRQHLSAAATGSAKVPVKVTTVDALAAEHGVKRIDVLHIDTEGWDSAVLAGAAKMLPTVRYLAFEVHQDFTYAPWHHTTVLSVLRKLDSYGLDCFWAGNDGSLLQATGCWGEEAERAMRPMGWSNMACLRRGDPWHALALQHAAAGNGH